MLTTLGVVDKYHETEMSLGKIWPFLQEGIKGEGRIQICLDFQSFKM